MENEKFKMAFFTVLTILTLIFFTKDIDLKGEKFYTNIKIVENPDTIDVLVNKNNQLPSYYVPKNLQAIDTTYSYENKLVRKEVKEAFEKLSHDASILGYHIVVISAYRDYDYQKNLFANYVKEKGLDYALLASAKPGHSEHQTGLAIDLEGSNKDYNLFEDTEEFEWMKNNAHKYGFILRYPKGKEHITGFKYEPWYYRYVGIDLATKLYNENITFEEYKEKI